MGISHSEAESLVSTDELTCTICLELLTEPVTLPCGHSFCNLCVEKCWKSWEEVGECFCPNCREGFPQKPKLKKNVMLAGLVAQVQVQVKMKQEEVESRIDVNDTKLCLPCEILCCEKHVKPHEQKGHKLVEPGKDVGELRCPDHKRSIQLHCIDDGKLMCPMCMDGQHQNHKVVAVEIAHTELKTPEDPLEPLDLSDPVGIFKKSIFFFLWGMWTRFSASADFRTPSLDRNSGHPRIVISEDLKTATLSQTTNLCPEYPDRFDSHPQVLSSESFSSDHHFWEVNVGSCRQCRIGVALNSMGRKGKESRLGENPESWCVEKNKNGYLAWHNNQRTSLQGNPNRLGFFLNCEEGELRCFGDLRVLHVFKGNFKEAVKPALGIDDFKAVNYEIKFFFFVGALNIFLRPQRKDLCG
uniref:Uncharacterized protein n=1 Tax=Eptatretus burgeri TaxID=7764 RepID=A0A8C4X061_EPTBU